MWIGEVLQRPRRAHEFSLVWGSWVWICVLTQKEVSVNAMTRRSSARDALGAFYKSQKVFSCASIVSGFCRQYSSASLTDRNHKKSPICISCTQHLGSQCLREVFMLLAGSSTLIHGNWCHILWLIAVAQGLCWCIRAAVMACSKRPLALFPFRRDDVWRNYVWEHLMT